MTGPVPNRTASHFKSFARERRRMRHWHADPQGPQVVLLRSPAQVASCWAACPGYRSEIKSRVPVYERRTEVRAGVQPGSRPPPRWRSVVF
jgi:hypothetical protein